MMEAFRTDPAGVARFYTDDARILVGGRRYTGTDQVRTYFSQVPGGANWTLEIVDVGGSQAEPWVLGRSTLGRPGTPGMTVDYLALLRGGTEGRLRYHIDMFHGRRSVRRRVVRPHCPKVTPPHDDAVRSGTACGATNWEGTQIPASAPS